MKSHLFGFALLSATAIVASAPAQAQNGLLTRSFVSSAGVDTNACTITEPCASFAQAYTKIGANGIIAALDPGKYGPLTGTSAITGPVTINGNGWAAITAPAQGNGITINAGTSDHVTLLGLEIDGAGAGYNGIVLNLAGSLTVTNCTLQNFFENGGNNFSTGNGILMQPTTGTLDFTITDTTASNTGHAGIFFYPPSGSPSANGVIDHVVADANSEGIDFYPVNATGGSIDVAILDSVVSNNSFVGIYAGFGSGTLKVSIDNVTSSGNEYGIYAESPANLLLGRSVITGNQYGIHNDTSPNTFYTYQDNRINLNGTDIPGGALSTTFTLQ